MMLIVPRCCLPDYLYAVALVWNFNDSSKTYTVNYTDTLGKPASVDITMKLRDPANINYDADLVSAATHPYDPAGGCLPSTGETVDQWAGDGSIPDPWDSDCYGDASGSSTGTRKAYGLGYLTWFIKSAQHTDEVYFDFTFSRPAMLMGDFTIGDVDGTGLTRDFNDATLHRNELPGNSYQDEVGFSASLNGANVPVTLFNLGANLTLDGQTVRSIYHTDQNNNVNPDDPLGTAHGETAGPIDTFSIMYSNGADDAADEQAHPEMYTWWSDTHGATNGASDSQAVRVSGFTFCMASPPVDYGDAASTYPTTSANNGASHVMTQQLYLGNCVDGDTDGQASAGADGDNGATGSLTYGTCAVAGNDEDGVPPVSLTDGQTAPQITVATHNTTGADATLACWIDYNGDHTFDSATERATATVADGATSAALTLPDVPADASKTTGGSTTMRCRLASAAADVANPTGAANSGEVEDYVVTLNAAAATCAVIVNTASITGVTETDSNAANNTASVSVQANCLQPQTDLKLTKAVSPSEVRRGGTATYTLTLTNESDLDATGVKVTDNLPTGLTITGSNATQGTFVGGIWDVGTLKAKTTVTLTINVSVD
jgi:uncharacterized repeat protein (TIGR01451 family)